MLNGYKVFDYSGQLLLHRLYDELYQVAVQPLANATTVYPNRPASPGLKERRAAAAAAASAASAASSSTTASAAGSHSAAASAYVPPHLRGRVGSEAVNVVAAMIADDRGRQSHKKITNTTKPHNSQPNNTNKSNNTNAKQQSEAKHRSKVSNEERKEAESHTPPTTTADSTATTTSAPSSLDDLSDLSSAACEKRLRAAVKKQRQIAELRDRQQSGAQLDAGQQDKLRAAEDVEAEVERLRQRIEQLKPGS